MGKVFVGATFGDWTVIGHEGRHCLVRCKCDFESRVLPFDLKAGKTTMCRSCKFDRLRGIRRPDLQTHGLANSPTQSVWSTMKQRCFNPRAKGFDRYGGRGIRVCERWVAGDGTRSGFHCFLMDMGVRPSLKHQLDRIDNNGHYEPSNCRWVLQAEQNYNKRNTWRFTAFGRLWTAEEAEKAHGVRRQLIAHRIKVYGMDPEVAMTRPSRLQR